jgi:hypothetical protein
MSLCEGACYPPATATNTGPDLLVHANSSISLQENALLTGTGTWTIYSGVGGNIANPVSPV